MEGAARAEPSGRNIPELFGAQQSGQWPQAAGEEEEGEVGAERLRLCRAVFAMVWAQLREMESQS